LRVPQKSVQATKRVLPVPPVRFDPTRDVLQRPRNQVANVLAPVTPFLNELRSLEIGDVLRDRLLRHPERFRQLRDGGRTFREG
jgi:hypothetical protein